VVKRQRRVLATGKARLLPSLGVFLVALTLAAGCKTSRTSAGPLLLFPQPPAKPRIQFLTWASSAEEVEGSLSDIVKLAFGDEPINRLAIQKPYGLAARDGVVYVCDTKIPAVCRLDFKSRTFSLLGLSNPGRLRKPINLIIDPLGYKFVADALRKQIVVFGPDDRYVRAMDVPEPSHPVDVALWENELYVLDNDDSCQIVVMDRQTGEVLRSFGGVGEEGGQFRIPNSLCFGPDGHLYVSDTLNWRIQKLSRDGESVWTRGKAGTLLGDFVRPRGLRVAPDGIIYVADAATEIVQMYNADGETLMHLGGPGVVPGALVLPAGVAIDASSIPYFKQYLHKDFDVEYLLFVSSQFGRHLVSVYAFGSFPEGYEFSQAQIASLPPVEAGQGEDLSNPPTGGSPTLQSADDIADQAGEDQQQKRRE
jgi:sugar lactone lactonase YvrE